MTQLGRADYDQMLKVKGVAPGEGVFLLRAQDALAARAIRYWATLAFDAGVPLPVVEQALQQADAMAAWPNQKLPDADHLAPHEREQLAYQIGRRSWATDLSGVSDDVRMLAQVHAYNEAAGGLKEALRSLFERGRWDEAGAFTTPPPDGVGATHDPVGMLAAIAAALGVRIGDAANDQEAALDIAAADRTAQHHAGQLRRFTPSVVMVEGDEVPAPTPIQLVGGAGD